jgi:hypothetical protein
MSTNSNNHYVYAIILVFYGQFVKTRLIIHWHKQSQRNRIQIETAGVGRSLCSSISGFRYIHKAFDLKIAALGCGDPRSWIRPLAFQPQMVALLMVYSLLRITLISHRFLFSRKICVFSHFRRTEPENNMTFRNTGF